MTAHRDVDLFLRAHFETTADATVLDGQIDAVLSETAIKRQQPAWLASLRSHTMSTTARSLGRPVPAPAWALLIILAMLIAITAVGVTTGTLRLPSAPVTNGPIVFGRLVPGGRLARRVLFDGERPAHNLARIGNRADRAGGDRLQHQVADCRSFDRPGDHAAARGVGRRLT